MEQEESMGAVQYGRSHLRTKTQEKGCTRVCWASYIEQKGKEGSFRKDTGRWV